MEIKTKFNVGDEVYYFEKGKYNTPRKHKISYIDIQIDKDGKRISYVILGDYISEYEVYGSKEEIIKAFSEKVNEL